MTVEKLNPDNTMVQQSDGLYAKYLALVVAKLAPNGVRITVDDIHNFADSGKVLAMIGENDAFSFKLVSPDEAQKLIEHDKGRCGHS